MATNDVNLGVEKTPDKDSEIAELRKRLEAAEAKRVNDENSAYGRLAKEAELRKQRETELAETRRQLAEFQAKNARSALTPEQIEALGETGAAGVERLVEAKLAPLSAQQPGATDLSPVLSRIEEIERNMRAAQARQTYTNSLVTWAASNGMPDLFARLSKGGSLAEKWAAYAQQNPAAVAAFENGDTENTLAHVKLFLFEHPGLSQQAATPSASGGFAAPANPQTYGPQEWLKEVNALEERLATGQITRAEHAKGFAEANAKLSAAQKGQA
jgi:hypothetical protein